MHTHNSAARGPRKVFNAAQHALRWLARGIYSVPLLAGTKRPKGYNGSADGWTELRITPATVNKYFHNGDNLGGLWGEASNWAIDVDLDTSEAQVAAQHFLPDTLVYGRTNAPGSHYIFRCKHAETQKYQVKEIGIIVEIRSNRTQTVLPGSTHPSGDRYQIDCDREIHELSWFELRRLVDKIAAASVAAWYYPEEGGRHDYVHALTGALLHAKWNERDVRTFMEAVRDAASSDDEEIKDRDGTIENTIKRYREGGHVQGLPTLANFMPPQAIQNLRRWLRVADFMPDNDETPPDSIAAEPVGEIDPRHFRVPGLVGEIMRWVGRKSLVKQPLFDLAIGLMATALASRNRYRIVGLDTPLQPYFMCVAGSAGGKKHVKDSLVILAKKLGLERNCFSASQSYHAMLDLISTPPHIACWIWDEAARYLKASGRSLSGPENAILSHVISLYGSAATLVPGMPARKNPIPPLENPFFLVIATTQPEQLLEAITNTDYATGLVNRFLLFDAGEKRSLPNEEVTTASRLFPSAIEDKFKEFDKIKVVPGEFIDVGYADYEAWQTLNDLRIYQVEQAEHTERGSEMWGRAHQNALIIAGLVAVGIDPEKPIITREIANWAVGFSIWSIERWFVRIDQSSSRSYTEAQSKHIERVIFMVRRFVFDARDEKEKALVMKGLCPRSFLVRKCRHIKLREFNEIMTFLIQTGLVGSSGEAGREVYWPKYDRQKKGPVIMPRAIK
jgi:hypothetical protein